MLPFYTHCIANLTTSADLFKKIMVLVQETQVFAYLRKGAILRQISDFVVLRIFWSQKIHDIWFLCISQLSVKKRMRWVHDFPPILKYGGK